MPATITLTNGERIPVTSGEYERVKDALLNDETAMMKVKSVSEVVWYVRPQDIASVAS